VVLSKIEKICGYHLKEALMKKSAVNS